MMCHSGWQPAESESEPARLSQGAAAATEPRAGLPASHRRAVTRRFGTRSQSELRVTGIPPASLRGSSHDSGGAGGPTVIPALPAGWTPDLDSECVHCLGSSDLNLKIRDKKEKNWHVIDL